MSNKESTRTNENSLVKLNRNGTRCKLVKRSKIWDMFRIVPGDSSKAICGECNGIISRGGGTGKSQCTTNLWKHLENRHPALFEEAAKYKEVVNRAEKVQRHPENSKAWELFSVDVGDHVIVKCLECDIEILRQNDNVTTDVLWYHIMSEHPMLYDKCVNEAMESVAIHRKGKRSSVWSEFTQHLSDPCKVICNTCNTVVSRGTSKDKLNTTNMRRHLIGNVHLAAVKVKRPEISEMFRDDELDNNGGVLKRRKMSAPSNDGGDDAVTHVDERSDKIARTPLDAQALLAQRPVDLFHTGLLGYGLYEQQKRGICCDFSLLLQRKSALANVEKDEHIREEVKIHSCIASLVSEKLRDAIENRQDQHELVETSKRIVQYFVEISYTGKLALNNSCGDSEARELYKLARHLQADTVCSFIQRTHPHISPLAIPDKDPDDSVTNIDTSHHTTIRDLNPLPEASDNLPKINKRKNYVPIAMGGVSEAATKSA